MTPRKYPIVWRVLAGVLALVVLVMVPLALTGRTRAPGWAEWAGVILVLALLPYVAITGRTPWWLRSGSRDVERR